jgi:hypothetical protein
VATGEHPGDISTGVRGGDHEDARQHPPLSVVGVQQQHREAGQERHVDGDEYSRGDVACITAVADAEPPRHDGDRGDAQHHDQGVRSPDVGADKHQH